MHEPFAVTPWELEAQRRREVIKADVRAARQRAPQDAGAAVLTPSRVEFRTAKPADHRSEGGRCVHPVGQALAPGK
jgi:hypothetical protein